MLNQRSEISTMTETITEYKPWSVLFYNPKNVRQEIVSYSLRSDAETHAQNLRRMMRTAKVEVVFNQPVVRV